MQPLNTPTRAAVLFERIHARYAAQRAITILTVLLVAWCLVNGLTAAAAGVVALTALMLLVTSREVAAAFRTLDTVVNPHGMPLLSVNMDSTSDFDVLLDYYMVSAPRRLSYIPWTTKRAIRGRATCVLFATRGQHAVSILRAQAMSPLVMDFLTNSLLELRTRRTTRLTELELAADLSPTTGARAAISAARNDLVELDIRAVHLTALRELWATDVIREQNSRSRNQRQIDEAWLLLGMR